MSEEPGAGPLTPAWEDLPPVVKRVLKYIGGLAVLGGAIGVWRTQLQHPGEIENVLLGLAALLVLGGIPLLWTRLKRRLGPRSRFQNPQALMDSHLVGREEDVEELIKRLQENRLVILVGESGAGKSLLLGDKEKGLCQRLNQEPETLAILLRSLGKDWIQGPQEALAGKLEALRPEVREKLRIQTPIEPSEALQTLARLHGARPILLFDQIDDYLNQHLKHLLRRKRLLHPDELAAQNQFWGELAALLKEGKVRCLFAVRRDNEWLSCMHFVEEDIHPLDRWKRAVADVFLGEITRKAVPLDPELGFTQLRERLLRDLGSSGWVLPIQMKLALETLNLLPSPSLADYLAAGGLSGLEALNIEHKVDAASRAAGCETAHIRGLLLKMVDPKNQATIPRKREELASEWLHGPVKLGKALAELERGDEGLVRQHAAQGEESASYQLRHDYLCQGILKLDRHARRWQVRLTESQQDFAYARGLRAHWRAMLAPPLQLRLLWERFRGRLTFGTARGYALLSTVKLIANVWVITAVLGLSAWGSYTVRERARELFAPLDRDGTDYLSYEETEALREIGRAPLSVRRAVLEEALGNEFTRKTLARRADEILFAVAGRDPEHGTELLASALRRHCAAVPLFGADADACLPLLKALRPDDGSAEILIAAAGEMAGEALWASFLEDPARALSPTDLRKAADAILGDLLDEDRGTTYVADIQKAAMAELSARFSATKMRPPQIADDVAVHLASSLKEEKDPDDIVEACEALASLGPWLPGDIAEIGGKRLLEILESSSADSFDLREQLQGLFERIPEADAVQIWVQLNLIDLNPKRSYHVSVADPILPALARRFSTGEAEKYWIEIDPFLSGRTSVGWRQLHNLVEARRPLAQKLSPEVARRSAKNLLDAVRTEKPDAVDLNLVASSILDLRDKLDTESKIALVEVLAKGIETEPRAEDKRELAETLGRFRPVLPAPATLRPIQSLVADLHATSEPSEIREIALALGVFRSELSSEAAKPVAEHILEIMRDPQSPSDFADLASSLEPIEPKLETEIVLEAARRILIFLDHEKETRLFTTLARLGPRLSGSIRRSALAKLGDWSCGEAAPLLGRDDLPLLFELASSPNCSSKGRAILVQRAEKLTGGKAGGADGSTLLQRWWSFLRNRKQDYPRRHLS